MSCCGLDFILLSNQEPVENFEEGSERTESVLQKDWSGLGWRGWPQGHQENIVYWI